MSAKSERVMWAKKAQGDAVQFLKRFISASRIPSRLWTLVVHHSIDTNGNVKRYVKFFLIVQDGAPDQGKTDGIMEVSSMVARSLALPYSPAHNAVITGDDASETLEHLSKLLFNDSFKIQWRKL